MKIHLVAPVFSTSPYGNESRLINYLTSEEGKKLNINCTISDLRMFPDQLGNFDKEYDATLVFKGESVTPELLSKNKSLTLLYFPDDILVYSQYEPLIAKLGPHYDMVYTFDLYSIDKFRELGCKQVKWLPSYTGKDMFYDMELRRDIDICFIGSINESRKIMLEKVKKEFPLKIILFEQGIKGFKYAQAMNRSKIVLNLAQGNTGTSQRVFEGMACGAFMLTNYIGIDERLFNDREHLCYWKDEKQLLNLIRFYLDINEETRKQIAQTGQREVMRSHLIHHRLSVILKDIKDLQKGIK